jgi:hypothetical protein
MAGTKPAKSKSDDVNATQGQQQEESRKAEEAKVRDLSEAAIDDETVSEEEHATLDRHERQDLNQGMQTGTYDDPAPGIKWGEDYRIRKTAKKPKQTDEPNKKSE